MVPVRSLLRDLDRQGVYGTGIAISGLTTDMRLRPVCWLLRNATVGSATLTVNNTTANTFAGNAGR